MPEPAITTYRGLGKAKCILLNHEDRKSDHVLHLTLHAAQYQVSVLRQPSGFKPENEEHHRQ
jgi:hypothetical protein